ncbi:MAG: ATP-dependent Clp protease ATP-binding subunit [Oscillospiraceae bacterium]|nr:ATP-dependent Clp protease ATP-binding subunit [Oscillospiraceae bacterium]
MICNRCNKRIAVIFMTRMEGSESINEGLCLTCAKELGIPQVNTMMENMGISDEDIDQMGEQLMGMMDGENFQKGGSETIPSVLYNMFDKDQKNQDKSTDDKSVDDKSFEHKSVDDKTSSKKNSDKKKKKPISNIPIRKFLDGYCSNLTKKAEDGILDRVIGRDKEVSRVIQILSRRSKNNPCLIGEPGVGKTAIAEGIAQKIVNKDVPFRLIGKEIYLLDLTALVAGTQFRGQFESRIKGLIDEVKSEKNIILFIDEVHSIVGTGDSEGSMSAANILKPSLSRGEIQVIGATTFDEYRKYIEKDSALERRFQPVTINEPTIDETIEVLKGIKEYYQIHHHVKITDEIIVMITNLSERYINDRFLPDKSIDLLDESCAYCSLRNKDLTVYEKLNKELKDLYIKEDTENSNEDDINYEILAKIKADILNIKEELKSLEPIVNNIYLKKEDVSVVLELWTGVPSDKINQDDLEKIKNMDINISKKIIGQREAIDLVVSALKRNRIGLSKRKKPSSFIFVGPTGVGKTELVKVLADELFNTVDPLIRIDMSEYMEKHSVSKLLGAAPGYVGHEEAGQLTEKVRRKPYSVILFDEIEKAHHDVMNILLQVLDEGRITDSHGRNIDFSNTVIILTSNAGSNDQNGIVGFNKTKSDVAKDKTIKALKDFLRPEFLGRIDEIVVFSPLSKESLESISDIMIKELSEILSEKGIKLVYTKNILSAISKLCEDGKYGARDLRKIIRKHLEDKIANLLIEKYNNQPDILELSVDDSNEIVVSAKII